MYFKGQFGCSEEAITVCAMTQIQNVFVTPSGKKKEMVSRIFISSDFLSP